MLRGLLIGAGYISRWQLQAFRRIGDARIEAVCDLDEAKARARAEEFGISRWYTDAARAIAEVKPGFVDIATRPDSHLRLVALAAENGCHVLLQKPMAPDLGDAHRIVQTASDAGIRLRILEMWRYLPVWAALRKTLPELDIGPVHSVRLTARRALRRSLPVSEKQPYFAEMPKLLLYEMGIHWLDCLSVLFGRIRAVAARMHRVNPLIRGEDVVQLLIWFDSGCAGTADLSWAAPCEAACTPGQITIQATDGIVQTHEDASSLTVITAAGATREIPVPRSEDDYVRAFEACQRDFVEGVLTGRPFDQSAEENLWLLAAVFAAYEAAETSAIVHVADLLERSRT